MNNKDKYIKAMDSKNASEELKKKTIENLQRKKEIRIPNWIPSVAIMFLLVLSVAWITKENEQKLNKPVILPNGKVEIAKKLDLPTVNSEENLEKILKDSGILGSKDEYSFDTKSVAQATNAITNEDSTLNGKESLRIDDTLDYSKTNNQVENVEEADIVKTDGKYIYSIGKDQIVITDIHNPSEMKVVTRIPFERSENVVYNPRELFVQGDKLIVITTLSRLINLVDNGAVTEDVAKTKDTLSTVRSGSTIETTSRIFIYNVKDKENAKLERELEVSGNYLSSRMIGNNFYIINQQYIAQENSTENPYTRPSYVDTIKNGEKKLLPYDSIYYFPENTQNSYLNILTLNVNSKEEAKIYSFLGAGNNIYASENNLYISHVKYNIQYEGNGTYISSGNVSTDFYKFNIQEQELKYVGMQNIQGRVINQFSMDEDNGYFRVALNNGAVNDEMENNLYVYDKDMKLVGKLEGLAKGERIYSVRFMQNRLYLVTFKTVDPLFVIDLSSPTNPKILGELKIPGVSEYLHPYDETHLIGIGQNTEEKNGRVTQIGMKISLFDVSDVNNPKEQSTLAIGNQGAYSEVLYNHKSFFFDKKNSVVGFPISLSEKSKFFTGAEFYKIDLENGISEKARIEDNSRKDYSNRIERIVYSKDNIYTISKNEIISLNRDSLEKISNIEF